MMSRFTFSEGSPSPSQASFLQRLPNSTLTLMLADAPLPQVPLLISRDSKQQWLDFLEGVEEIHIESLFIRLTSHCVLLRLAHICFSNLLTLNINRQNMESLESLQTLEATSIKNLFLRDNLFVEGKSLRKIACPRIQFLDISRCLVGKGIFLTQLDGPRLQDLRMNAKGLKHELGLYYLYRDEDEDGEEEHIGSSWAMKLQSRQLRRLQMMHQSALGVDSSAKSITSKYPAITTRIRDEHYILR